MYNVYVTLVIDETFSTFSSSSASPDRKYPRFPSSQGMGLSLADRYFAEELQDSQNLVARHSHTGAGGPW